MVFSFRISPSGSNFPAFFFIGGYNLSPAYFFRCSRQGYFDEASSGNCRPERENPGPVPHSLRSTSRPDISGCCLCPDTRPVLHDRKYRVSQGFVITPLRFCFHMEKGILLSKINSLFHKIQKLAVFFHASPVYPADLVVLTPCVIIPLLRISPFIPLEDHRGSLGKEQHGKSIFQLPETKLPDILLPGRAFHPTVPGTVIFQAILVILSIFLIMPLLIGYHICHGKSILIRQIIDHAVIGRISLVRNKNSPIIFHRPLTYGACSREILRYIPLHFYKIVFFLPVSFLRLHHGKTALFRKDKGLFIKKLRADSFAHKMETVNMVCSFPVFYDLQHSDGGISSSK